MSKMTTYQEMLGFLSQFLGSSTEIILFDTEKIIAIKNPTISTHTPGAPLGEMEGLFLKEGRFHQTDHVVNYRALAPGGEKLRSATFFIKDAKGRLEGMLTINKKVGDLVAVRDLIHALINGEHRADPVSEQDRHRYFETFSGSFENLMNSVIAQGVARYGVPPDRLRPEEKIEIVRLLDEKGTFLIKGSVIEVAKRLNSSEATIYRYLNQLTT